MTKSVDAKIFLLLLGSSLIASVFALPYTLELSPQIAEIFSPAILVAQIVQSLIIFSIAIQFGLKLSRKVGFGLPILEKVLRGEEYRSILKKTTINALKWGGLTSILIILFGAMFYSISLPFLRIEASIPAWKSLLVSFYGGIAEEVLLRFFFMSLLVWLFQKITRTKLQKPSAAVVWSTIFFSSIIFGLGHLPVTGNVTTITPLVVARALLLNGVGGVIFGWLYWKKGLESAIISHFFCDICIHVVFPLLVSPFI